MPGRGCKGQIPAYIKTDYLKALISAGFKHIDAVSFVSPKAVPQMADSEEVLKELDPPDDVEIIGIVVNEKGAQRAIATEAVRTLGFPYSVSPTFLAEQSAPDAGRRDRRTGEDQRTRAKPPGSIPWFISRWRLAIRTAIRGMLAKWSMRSTFSKSQGVRTISLADTVGLAGPAQIRELFRSGDFKVRLSGDWSAPAQPSGPGGGKDIWPRMMRAAAGLIPRWADWADVPSRRMRWWEILRPKKWWRR